MIDTEHPSLATWDFGPGQHDGPAPRTRHSRRASRRCRTRGRGNRCPVSARATHASTISPGWQRPCGARCCQLRNRWTDTPRCGPWAVPGRPRQPAPRQLGLFAQGHWWWCGSASDGDTHQTFDEWLGASDPDTGTIFRSAHDVTVHVESGHLAFCAPTSRWSSTGSARTGGLLHAGEGHRGMEDPNGSYTSLTGAPRYVQSQVQRWGALDPCIPARLHPCTLAP
jgi:hypothetical protein